MNHFEVQSRRRWIVSPVALMAEEYKAAGYDSAQIHALLQADGFSISKKNLRAILSA